VLIQKISLTPLIPLPKRVFGSTLSPLPNPLENQVLFWFNTFPPGMINWWQPIIRDPIDQSITINSRYLIAIHHHRPIDDQSIITSLSPQLPSIIHWLLFAVKQIVIDQILINNPPVGLIQFWSWLHTCLVTFPPVYTLRQPREIWAHPRCKNLKHLFIHSFIHSVYFAFLVNVQYLWTF